MNNHPHWILGQIRAIADYARHLPAEGRDELARELHEAAKRIAASRGVSRGPSPRDCEGMFG
jgi:hypothetical protein